tara:strand:- start:225 stop:491 length:267 start_codon:yes stop_codon:yes gene_type:complete
MNPRKRWCYSDKECPECQGDTSPISDCCGGKFEHPGWPDSDRCGTCGEHSLLHKCERCKGEGFIRIKRKVPKIIQNQLKDKKDANNRK